MHPQVYLSVLTVLAVAAMALWVGLRRERTGVHWLVIALMLSMILWAIGLWRPLANQQHQETALMLDFASLSQGELGEVEVDAVTADALKMAALHRRPAVELRFEPADELPPVQGSSEHLIQAVLNLAINALQAVSQQGSGTVRVVTRSRDDGVEIRVSDDGPGIPRAIRNRIFDPFFTTKAAGEGSGLGLAITYDIIREHRGVLELHSEEGEGAEFTIRLPARSES